MHLFNKNRHEDEGKRLAAEIKLVRRFQVGEIAAYEELMREEAPYVLGLIRRYIRSEELVDDLFQETCLIVWRIREQLRSPEKFRSWLFQITRNVVFTHIRKKNWQPDLSFFGLGDSLEGFSDHTPGPRDLAEREQWKIILNREISSLEPQTQEMLAMRFEAGLKLREISEALNIPLGTVCVKVSSALKSLRKKLEKRGIDLKYYLS